MATGIEERIDRLTARPPRFPRVGVVAEVRGTTVVAVGLKAALGEVCRIDVGGERPVWGEVSGFLPGGRVFLTPYGDLGGIAAGDQVVAVGRAAAVPVGPALLGRALDGIGRPLDGRGPVFGFGRAVAPRPLSPLARLSVEEPLWTGIRVVDGLLTLGKGQRVGIFAGAGVGKTTLLHQLMAGAAADVVVAALVGERGREVSAFYRRLSGPLRRRTVLVAATSDAAALLRVRAAETALTVAEAFRDQGKDVLLVMDSLTRVAMAQREHGLASGEVASMRGYTPSVFHLLPRLLERAGRTARGSITGLFTVLLEADDPTEPIGDAVRGILDGALYLSRRLAQAQHFPAVDVLASLSRTMDEVVTEPHRRLAAEARAVLATLEEGRDLVQIGAYQPGSNPELDRALALETALKAWLRQGREEWCDPTQALADLSQILEGDGGHGTA
ncbi:MAG: FliI/YscN family ATPase [Firmicutes bacterium]|nr:FliI/YscN family ATPase [Alicyclobacillaceae bacterium]MCL6497290.1 FliI/YscN family ATPase [Bacillota bacterium]